MKTSRGWFRDYVKAHLKGGDCLLDLGAGRGRVQTLDFRDLAQVCGCDPDPVVMENPLLHEARVMRTPLLIPFETNAFDVVISSFVLEHVEKPDLLFNEIRRVLRPGGLFIARTSNKWHYVSVLARITPQDFHERFNKQRGRSKSDAFPTYFGCNTEKDLRKYSGMEVKEIGFAEGEPGDMCFSRMAEPIGMAYKKLVELPALERFRGVMICCLVANIPITAPVASCPVPRSE